MSHYHNSFVNGCYFIFHAGKQRDEPDEYNICTLRSPLSNLDGVKLLCAIVFRHFCLLSAASNRDIFLLALMLFLFYSRKETSRCVAFLVVIFKGSTQHQAAISSSSGISRDGYIRSVYISKKKYNYRLRC